MAGIPHRQKGGFDDIGDIDDIDDIVGIRSIGFESGTVEAIETAAVVSERERVDWERLDTTPSCHDVSRPFSPVSVV